MNVHMAHMFHVATQQAALPAKQRTATPESIYQSLGVEFGKFETKSYIEAMKSEIEISYPIEITDIIKAKRAASTAQSGSSTNQMGRQSITSEPSLRPGNVPSAEVAQESSTAPIIETTPNNLALGK